MPPVAWAIEFYEAPDGTVPAESFLDSCPMAVEAKITAVLGAVADAPPPQFSGGGLWEAMHGAMAGIYEVRVPGPGREQFRLFCVLENADAGELARRGLDRPTIVALTGLRKPWRTVFRPVEYERVRRLANEHLSQLPRRIAR